MKNFLFLLYIIFSFEIYSVKNQQQLPPYYPKCYRDDPKLNDCLLKATETVKPFLKRGVPELNFPKLSPFIIPEVSLEQGTSAVNYKAILNNIKIIGLDSYHFRKFEFDVANLRFLGSLDVDDVYIKADYNIQGKILAVPIEGKGVLTANITNSNATVSQQAKLVTKKGVTYLEPEKTVVNIDVGGVQPSFDGLFGGNEILAKATNEVIHDNLKELVEEIKPAIEEVMTRVVQDLIFKSVARIPYDELYPVHGKKT
ncbi:JHBP domain containing protein [Asbolus verrucosus]|uniref:JHBP domain containing protein n=1 Tax=Asbolus verrucosus TaxID=1661398 RepID=A0A482VWA0_ASBVE|nr:JHBP domain containing protein [Asbolus verrucosus]